MAVGQTDKLRIIVEVDGKQATVGLAELQKKLDGVDKAGRRAGTGLKETEKSGTAVERAMGRIGQSAQTFIVGYMGVQGVRALVNFADESRRMAATSAAASVVLGNRLPAAIGNSENALNRLRRATSGTISDVNLLANSARGMSTFAASGLSAAKSFQVLETTARFATLAAKAYGIDGAQAFDRIITGLSRGSPQLLDDFGIIIDLQDKYYSSVDAAEQKIRIANDAIRQMEKFLRENGDEVERNIGLWDRLGASLRNWSTAFGRAAFSKPNPGLDHMTPPQGIPNPFGARSMIRGAGNILFPFGFPDGGRVPEPPRPGSIDARLAEAFRSGDAAAGFRTFQRDVPFASGQQSNYDADARIRREKALAEAEKERTEAERRLTAHLNRVLQERQRFLGELSGALPLRGAPYQPRMDSGVQTPADSVKGDTTTPYFPYNIRLRDRAANFITGDGTEGGFGRNFMSSFSPGGQGLMGGLGASMGGMAMGALSGGILGLASVPLQYLGGQFVDKFKDIVGLGDSAAEKQMRAAELQMRTATAMSAYSDSMSIDILLRRLAGNARSTDQERLLMAGAPMASLRNPQNIASGTGDYIGFSDQWEKYNQMVRRGETREAAEYFRANVDKILGTTIEDYPDVARGLIEANIAVLEGLNANTAALEENSRRLMDNLYLASMRVGYVGQLAGARSEAERQAILATAGREITSAESLASRGLFGGGGPMGTVADPIAVVLVDDYSGRTEPTETRPTLPDRKDYSTARIARAVATIDRRGSSFARRYA